MNIKTVYLVLMFIAVITIFASCKSKGGSDINSLAAGIIDLKDDSDDGNTGTPSNDVCTGEDNAVYVSMATGEDQLNPGTKALPKKTIQAGIDCADHEFTSAVVRVAEGTYTVNGSMNRLDQSGAGIILAAGISVYGGYSSTNWEQRNSAVYKTYVNDNSTGDTGYFSDPNRVFHAGSGITPSTVIDGFVITGGGGAFSSAITNDGGSPTIQNNTIHGGTGWSWSYGIYTSNGASPVINGNTITGGTGSVDTYGIKSDESTPTVSNNIINGGNGSTGSYGMDNYYSSTQINGNTINGGTSTGGSIGIGITGASPFITNNIIKGEGSSPLSSYGIYFGAASGTSEPIIASNTIHAGNGTNTTAGIEISFSNPAIINNIIIVSSGTFRYGIYEAGIDNEADPSSLENNDVFITSNPNNLLYKDTQTLYDYTVICSGNFGDVGCSHTLNTPAGISNISVNPLVDGNFAISGSSPVSVRQGGKNLSSLFTDDRNGSTRTVPWSMGAFEQD